MYKQEDGKEMEGNGVWSPQNAQKWRASTEETSARGPEDTMNGGVDRNPKSEYDQTEHTSTNAKHDTHVPRSEKDGAEREEVVLTRHRLTLSGDSWPDILKENHAAFDEAFDIDICGALGLPRGSVKDAKLGSDGQTVSFGVRHPTSLLKSDVKRALGQCSFENTWRLYGSPRTEITPDAACPPLRASEEAQPPLYDMEVSTPSVPWMNNSSLKVVQPRNNVSGTCSIGSRVSSLNVLHGTLVDEDTVVTRHRVKFNGSSWGSILQRKRAAVEAAFDADVCKTLSLPRGSVQIGKLGSDDFSVDFSVRHPESLRKKDISRALAGCRFENTWRLYELDKPTSPDAAAPTLKASERAPEQLHDTEVSPKRPSCGMPNLPSTRFTESFPEDRAPAADNVPFSNTSPGTTTDEGSTITHHRVKFSGDSWPDILKENHAAFDEAFDIDICGALGLPRGSVKDAKLGSDGQTVSFGVRHPTSLLKSDVKRALGQCSFENAWRLYGSPRTEITPDAAYPPLRASEEAQPPLYDMEVSTPSVAGGCGSFPLKIVRPRLIEHGKCSISANTPSVEVLRGALYDENTVVTRHRVKFNGSSWGSILKHRLEELDKALDADVCETVGLPPGSVEGAKYVPDGLTVSFGVRHSASLHRKSVAELLAKGQFVNIWSLYARYKREGATNGVPHGSSGATGSIQPTVCSPKNASSHTPSTHHKMVEAVEVPHDVHARPSQPQHQGVLEETTVPLEIKEKRADVAGGVSVDTFHTTPVGETSVVTRHRVKLNGDDWPDVFNNQRVAFDDAFDCDVCTSVKLPRGSVQDVTLGPDGQSVAFGVQHPSSLLRSDVKKALRTCPFTRTLALYNSRPIGDYINPTVSALAAPNVLAPQPIGQYADACSLPPERANQSHVRTMVSCDLVDGGLFTRSSPFIEVYNGACVEEDIVVTHHGVMLNGANWMSVFMKGVPFDDAFDADVCGAVGLPRGCVENIKMGPDGHLVTFSVRHPASVRGSDIKKALRKSPFVNTLRLYQSGSVASSNINTPPTLGASEEAPIQLRQKESAPYTLSSELGNPPNTKTLLPFENTNETTNTSAVSVPTFNAVPKDQTRVSYHGVRVSGSNWTDVFTRHRAAFNGVFEADVCDAIGLPRGNVEDIMVFPEKQSIAFGVRHPVSLTDEDIDKALGTCLFRNTLRLFALKTDGTQCGTTLPLTTADSTVPSACNREDFSTFDSPESNHLQPKKREAYDVSDGFTSTDGTEPLQMPLNINNEQCAASYHRVKLTGNRWSHVCTKNRAAFDEALGSDICSVLNLPRGSVENITVSQQDQTVSFVVRRPVALRESSIDSALWTCTFKRTLGLYNFSAANDLSRIAPPALKISDSAYEGRRIRNISPRNADIVVTEHHVKFSGDGWWDVFSRRRAEFVEAFETDLCKALDLPRGSVGDVHLDLSGQSVSFRVHHPASLHKAGITRLIYTCPFKDTLQVYIKPPTVEQSQVTSLTSGTSKDVLEQFPGGYITPPALRALPTAPDSHPNLGIDRRYDGTVVTHHRVKFEGDGWADVFNDERAAFNHAFRMDVCEALQLPYDKITNITTFDDNQIVNFDVCHPRAMEMHNIVTAINMCPFKRTVGLYSSLHKGTGYKLLPALEDYESSTNNNVSKDYQYRNHTPQNEDEGRKFAGIMCYGTSHDKNQGVTDDSSSYQGNDQQRNRGEYPSKTNEEKQGQLLTPDALRHPLLKNDNESASELKFKNTDDTHDMPPQEKRGQCKPNTITHSYKIDSRLQDSLVVPPAPETSDVASPKQRDSLVVPPAPETSGVASPKQRDSLVVPPALEAMDVAAPKQRDSLVVPPALEAMDVASPKQRDSLVVPPALEAMDVAAPKQRDSLVVPPALEAMDVASPKQRDSLVVPPAPETSGVAAPKQRDSLVVPPALEAMDVASPKQRDSLVVPPALETSGVAAPKQRDSLVVPPALETSGVAAPKQRDSLVVPPALETSGVAAPKQRDSLVVPPALEAMDVAAPKQRDSLVVPPALEAMDVASPKQRDSLVVPPALEAMDVASPKQRDSLVVPPALEAMDVAAPKQRDSLVVPPALEAMDVASPKQRDSLVVPPAPETSDVAAPKQRDSLVVPPALEAMDVASPKQRDSLVVPPAPETSDVASPKQRDSLVVPPALETSGVAAPKQRDSLVVPPAPETSDVASPKQRDSLVVPPALETSDVAAPKQRDSLVVPPAPETSDVAAPKQRDSLVVPPAPETSGVAAPKQRDSLVVPPALETSDVASPKQRDSLVVPPAPETSGVASPKQRDSLVVPPALETSDVASPKQRDSLVVPPAPETSDVASPKQRDSLVVPPALETSDVASPKQRDSLVVPPALETSDVASPKQRDSLVVPPAPETSDVAAPKQRDSLVVPPAPETSDVAAPKQRDSLVVPPAPETSDVASPKQRDSLVVPPALETSDVAAPKQRDSLVVPPAPETSDVASPKQRDSLVVPPAPETSDVASPKQRDSLVVPPAPETSDVASPKQRDSLVVPPAPETSDVASPKQRNSLTVPSVLETSDVAGSRLRGSWVFPPPSEATDVASPKQRNSLTVPSVLETSDVAAPKQRDSLVVPPAPEASDVASPKQRNSLTVPSVLETSDVAGSRLRGSWVFPPPSEASDVASPKQRDSLVVPPAPETSDVAAPKQPDSLVVPPALEPTDVVTPKQRDSLAVPPAPEALELPWDIGCGDDIVFEHCVTFCGGKWDYLFSNHRSDFEQAFDEDVTVTIGLPRGSVKGMRIGSNGQSFFFYVSYPRSSDSVKVGEDMKKCPFTNTLALYDSVTGGSADSSVCEDVMVENTPARTIEFGYQVCSTSRKPRGSIRGCSVKVVKPRPFVDKSALGSNSLSLDVFYSSLQQEETTVTHYRAILSGANWNNVLGKWLPSLKRAFDLDVCDAAALPAGRVRDFLVNHDDLSFTFGVSHRASLKQKELVSLVKKYQFPHTWRVYEAHCEQGMRDDNFNIIEIEMLVLKEDGPIKGADGNRYERVAVTHLEDSSSKFLSSSLSVLKENYFRRVPGSDSREMIRLPRRKKYVKAPSSTIVTRHRLRFPVKGCDYVPEDVRRLIPQALNHDISNALNISWRCVEDIKFNSDGRLILFGVRHPSSMSSNAVRKALTKCDFPYTWKIYEPDTLVQLEENTISESSSEEEEVIDFRSYDNTEQQPQIRSQKTIITAKVIEAPGRIMEKFHVSKNRKKRGSVASVQSYEYNSRRQSVSTPRAMNKKPSFRRKGSSRNLKANEGSPLKRTTSFRRKESSKSLKGNEDSPLKRTTSFRRKESSKSLKGNEDSPLKRTTSFRRKESSRNLKANEGSPLKRTTSFRRKESSRNLKANEGSPLKRTTSFRRKESSRNLKANDGSPLKRTTSFRRKESSRNLKGNEDSPLKRTTSFRRKESSKSLKGNEDSPLKRTTSFRRKESSRNLKANEGSPLKRTTSFRRKESSRNLKANEGSPLKRTTSFRRKESSRNLKANEGSPLKRTTSFRRKESSKSLKANEDSPLKRTTSFRRKESSRNLKANEEETQQTQPKERQQSLARERQLQEQARQASLARERQLQEQARQASLARERELQEQASLTRERQLQEQVRQESLARERELQEQARQESLARERQLQEQASLAREGQARQESLARERELQEQARQESLARERQLQEQASLARERQLQEQASLAREGQARQESLARERQLQEQVRQESLARERELQEQASLTRERQLQEQARQASLARERELQEQASLTRERQLQEQVRQESLARERELQEQARQESLARERQLQEQASLAREGQARQESLARERELQEQARQESLARERQLQEQVRQESLARERELQEQASLARERELQEQVRQESLARERELQEQASLARERQLQEQASLAREGQARQESLARERELQEQARQESLAREGQARQESLARERELQEQARQESLARERQLQEQASLAREGQARQESLARERELQEQARQESLARERELQEQARQESLARERQLQEQARQESLARERQLQEQARQESLARERELQEQASLARERELQEQARQESLARERQLQEQASLAREGQARQESLAREGQARQESLARERQLQEQASLARERELQEQARQESLARERQLQEQASLARERELQEQASLAREGQARQESLARERQLQEQASLARERQLQEQARQESLAREGQARQESLARERELQEQARQESLARERQLQEQASLAREGQARQESLARERELQEQARQESLARERELQEQARQESLARERQLQEQARQESLARERQLQEQARQESLARERELQEQASLARERELQEQARQESLARERQLQEQASLAREGQARQESLAREGQARQESLARERQLQEQASLARERELQEQARQESLARERQLQEQASLARERELQEQASLAREGQARQESLARERQLQEQASLARERQLQEQARQESLARERQLQEQASLARERELQEQARQESLARERELQEQASLARERQLQEQASLARERELQEQASLAREGQARQESLARERQLQEQASLARERELQEQASLARERELQEQASLARERQLQEQASLARERELQEQASLARERELQEQARQASLAREGQARQESLARERELQEQASLARERELQEQARQASLARERQLQEQASLARERELQEQARQASLARERELQEQASLARERQLQEQARQESLARERQLQEQASLARERELQEQARQESLARERQLQEQASLARERELQEQASLARERQLQEQARQESLARERQLQEQASLARERELQEQARQASLARERELQERQRLGRERELQEQARQASLARERELQERQRLGRERQLQEQESLARERQLQEQASLARERQLQEQRLRNMLADRNGSDDRGGDIRLLQEQLLEILMLQNMSEERAAELRVLQEQRFQEKLEEERRMQDELLEEKLVEERRLQDELLEEKLAEERELQGQLLQEKLQEERVMHERILKDLLLSKNGGSTVERSDTVLNDGGANSISPAAGISPVLHFSVIPFPGGGRGFRESRDAAHGEMVSSGLSSEGVLQRGYDPVLRAGGDGTDLTGSPRGTNPPAVHPVTNVDDVVVASPKHTDPPGRVLPVDGKHIAAAPSVRGGYSNDCLSSVADVASNEVNKSLAAGAIVPDGGGGPSSFVAARSEDFTVVTYHHMKFCGDNWNEVLEQKRDEFFYIFDKEICSVLNLPRGSVENIKLGTDGLSVSFGVRHSNLLPKDEVDNLLATCEFPGLWKLYKPKKRPPLLAALDGRKDVSACPLSGSFSRYWNSAGVRDLSPRSFPESGVRSDADGSKLGTGATSSEGVVCNLYRVGFVGGFWSGVIDKRFSIAVDCFMRDAAAEGLSPRNVERVVSMDSGNVVFSVWVEHAPSLSQGEVCKVLDHAPFPSMWKLYDSLVNEGVVGRTTTLHRVGLVGTEWARVTNDKLVKEVFIQDVAEALNVSPEDINISECCVSDKLVVGFYVSHSPALTEVDIDDMLAHAPLSRVWGLCQSPRSQSWQTVRVKGLSVRSRSCLPSADTSQTFTLRGDSPSSRGGGPWLTTPLNRRSGARHQWHLAPLSGMGAPSSLVGQNIRGQGSEAVQNATDRSPDPSCYTTQPVTISAEMRGCKVSPRSAAGKQEHRRRKGSSPGSISSARTLLPRVDLLEVGELLALMRQRNSRDDNVYLPSLSTGLRGSGRADYGVRRYMRRK